MNIYQYYEKIIKKYGNPWGDENPYDTINTNHNENRSNKLKNLFDLIIGNRNKYCPVILIIFIIMIILWLISGFYTIKESDRGVVTRFGKFSNIVLPGLNWKLQFIDRVYPINVEAVREIVTTGIILTSDENLINVEMNIQYRISNPRNYLFSVTNPKMNLKQATNSVLRDIIGKFNINTILTKGHTLIRQDMKDELKKTINQYNMGITLLDVNLPTICPPKEVKSAFYDAIIARENEQQYVHEAESYANQVQSQARGKAQHIIINANAYKTRTILEAQGEIIQIAKILPVYKKASEFIKERLYIETMEDILIHTNKIVIMSSNNKNLFLFVPLKNFSKKNHIYQLN